MDTIDLEDLPTWQIIETLMYKYKATILNDSTYYFELTAFMSKTPNDENEL